MSTPLRWAGQYQDQTGLYYMQARYYDPQTAQFLTSDPLAPLTGQPYSYTGANPVNFTDPSGLDETIPPSVGPYSGLSAATAGGLFAGYCQQNPAASVCAFGGTIGLCLNFGGGAGVIGAASGCVALVGGSPTLIGTLGFGAGSPTVQGSVGLLVSNAQSPCELDGWFGGVDGSVGFFPSVGDQFSANRTSSGRFIWENQVTIGYNNGLPVPFQLQGIGSYTWTS